MEPEKFETRLRSLLDANGAGHDPTAQVFRAVGFHGRGRELIGCKSPVHESKHCRETVALVSYQDSGAFKARNQHSYRHSCGPE